mgnify:CR=1 FL=1
MCELITTTTANTVRPKSQCSSRVVYLSVMTAFVIQTAGCSLFPAAASHLPRHSYSSENAGAIDTRTQAEACRRTAMQLAAHEKDEHAIAQLERARELDPGIKGVAHLLAVLYDRQGRIDAAEREYLLALKETKNSPDVLNDYGYFLYCRDELTRAEKALRDCLKQDRTHKTAILNLGMVLAKQGKNEASFAAFEKVVGPAAAHHNLGMLQLRAGSREEGLRHLEQAADRDPSLPSATIIASLYSQPETESLPALAENHSRVTSISLPAERD